LERPNEEKKYHELRASFCDDLFHGAAQHSGLSKILGVVRGPYAYLDDHDGLQFVDEAGYCSHTRIWLDHFGQPAGTISSDDILERFYALSAGSVGGTLALLAAALDLPAARIHNAISPTFVTWAWQAGAGKTFAFECLSLLRDGEQLAPLAQTSPDELKRQIDVAFLSGRTIIVVDNLRRGSALELNNILAMMTSHDFMTRLVSSGEAQIFSPKAFLFGMTGIDVAFGDEASRRVLMVEMVPPDGEHRYPHLDRWFNEHRADIYAVLLEWIRRWDEAGRPAPRKTDSRIARSFPHWNAVVGGILCYNLPDLADHWLDESTRSVPPLKAEMLWCLENWPRDANASWARHRGATFVSFVGLHIDMLPTLAQKLIEQPRKSRGQAMAAGRFLLAWSQANPDILRMGKDRDGRFYVPAAEVPHDQG